MLDLPAARWQLPACLSTPKRPPAPRPCRPSCAQPTHAPAQRSYSQPAHLALVDHLGRQGADEAHGGECVDLRRQRRGEGAQGGWGGERVPRQKRWLAGCCSRCKVVLLQQQLRLCCQPPLPLSFSSQHQRQHQSLTFITRSQSSCGRGRAGGVGQCRKAGFGSGQHV